MPEAMMRHVPPELEELVFAEGSPLADVVRRGQVLARTDAVLLLTGERGTGKRMLARILHAQSARAGRPFAAVDCSALDGAALEGELFGTDAGGVCHPGRLAECEGGTLFLANVDALTPALQRRVLRLLQERRYEPVGSAAPHAADVRLIASTHRDLNAEVVLGRFRRDLYYRLLVCPVDLPALRERPMDVAPLFLHLWRQRGEQRPVDPALLRALERHSWPGNVRELEMLVADLSGRPGSPPGVTDLPLALRPTEPEPRAPQRPVLMLAPPPPAAPEPEQAPGAEAAAGLQHRLVPESLQLPVDLPTLLRELEEAYIDLALHQARGNKRAAADLLGLQRTTLVEKLRRRRDRQDGDAPEQDVAPRELRA